MQCVRCVRCVLCAVCEVCEVCEVCAVCAVCAVCGVRSLRCHARARPTLVRWCASLMAVPQLGHMIKCLVVVYLRPSRTQNLLRETE